MPPQRPGPSPRGDAAAADGMRRIPDAEFLMGSDRRCPEECHCGSTISERPRQTRDMLRHVAAAEGFLRAHIDRPVYTEELCAALQVSTRTLHQSFVAVYGMSPHAFLKRRRRLVLVHRALRSVHGKPA